MSYSTIEAALLATVRALSHPDYHFDAATSARSDYTVKDSVGSRPAIVVRQGGRSIYADSLTDPRRAAHGMRQERHTAYLDVFLPRQDGQGGDSVAYIALQELVGALIDWLAARPTLGGACTRCQVVAAEPPMFLEARPHIAGRIVLQIDAETPIALASGEVIR